MEDTPELRELIVEAVKAAEITKTDAWQDLSALSSNTVVDTFETFDDEIRFDGDHFIGPVTWYVTLNYGPRDGDGPLTMSESFPGSFAGHIENGQPIIDSLRAQVEGFYD